MKVQGHTITDGVIAAGNAAMSGEFTARDVRHAISRTGFDEGRSEDSVLDRVADRLMQKARKAGLIVAINNKQWRAVDRP